MVILAENQLVSRGVIDRWILVEDYAEQALSYFNLSKEKLGIGYYYSIAELVSIYLCDTNTCCTFRVMQPCSKALHRNGWLRG